MCPLLFQSTTHTYPFAQPKPTPGLHAVGAAHREGERGGKEDQGEPRKTPETDRKETRIFVRCTLHPPKSGPFSSCYVPAGMQRSSGTRSTHVPELVADLKLNLKTQTARNYLRRAGLKGRKPAKKPMMTPQHRLKRVNWARAWGGYDFSDVIFSDEKKWICVGKGLATGRHVLPSQVHRSHKPQAGGGSCMVWVWGGMCKTRTFPLVRIPTTLDGASYAKSLKTFFKTHRLIPLGSRASRPRVPWTFQHDNSSVHRANVVETTLSSGRCQCCHGLPSPQT